MIALPVVMEGANFMSLRLAIGVAWLAMLLLAGLAVSAWAQEEDRRPAFFTFWGAWGTDGVIEDLPGLSSNFEQTWFAGVGLTKEFGQWGKSLTWEVEGQAIKHFGWQTNYEFNGIISARWHRFPWNQRVSTSFAVSTGLSWASEVPKMEAELDDSDARLLQYLGFEFAFSRPETPDRIFAIRLHHRSSAYGVFGPAGDGSNFVAVGLRRRF